MRGVLVILLAFAAGCTSWRDYVHNGFKVGPNFCPPAAPVADSWIDAENPNVSTEPPQDADWWRTFNDPVLDSLVCTAYQQNLTLRIAGLRIMEARAQRAIAAGELFPQVQQLNGAYTRTQGSANAANALPNRFYDDWTVGSGSANNVAGLAWELDFWGQFRRALESADAHVCSTIYNYDDVLVLLISDVAGNYVTLRTAEQRIQYARKNVEIQKGSLNLADVKFRNGATTRLDVTQGQSNLSQTEATIPPLEAQRRQAANQLCILLGMPPRDIEKALGKRDIPSASPLVAVGVPADLLRRRPDVRRAEADAAAQCALIGVATAALYPHFSISGSIFYDAQNFKDLFDANSLGGSIGPSFRWDILNYGRLLSGIRVEDARFQQLVVQYQNTVLTANAEAENALVGFLEAQQQVKCLATSAQAAEQSLGLVEEQYRGGKTDFNRVFNVQQALTQQQDQLAVARGSVAENLVQLYKALGGGWQIRLGGPNSEPPEAEPAAPAAEPLPAPLPEENVPR
jgi:NodT family efflux transporter outer membrane factor (OMF) lipoprotein